MRPKTARIDQRATVRLVSSAWARPPALGPLAASFGALEALAELESVTNGRLAAQTHGMADLDPKELVFGRSSHTFVNAAFAHTRPRGNRFNDERRGAWYCAFDSGTALAEVSFHLTRELETIGRFENSTDYVELLADFNADFHDLRAPGFGVEPALDKDTAIAYPAGQALARMLRLTADSNGIVYRSRRRVGGTCLVAFRPEIVQAVRQGAVWNLEWKGKSVPVATKR